MTEGTIVTWTETDNEELSRIYERAKRDDHYRESFTGRDFQAPTRVIIGRILAIAYQQGVIATAATGHRVSVERIQPCWKILVAITPSGRIVEKSPEDVRVLT